MWTSWRLECLLPLEETNAEGKRATTRYREWTLGALRLQVISLLGITNVGSATWDPQYGILIAPGVWVAV